MADNIPLTLDDKPVGSQEWLDADTLKADGQPVRIKGFNAPEVAHIKGGVFVPRNEVTDTSLQDVQTVMKHGGYTNIVPTGTDAYKRTVGSVQNPAVDDLGNALTRLGIQETNGFSDTKAVADGLNIRSAAALFPELASKDPLISLGLQKRAERRYVPNLSVLNEQEYAGFKNSVGVGPAAEFAEEADRLEGILKDQSLRPDLRIKLKKQLDDARQAVFIASTVDPRTVGNVLIRHDDRTIMNKAHDQFTTTLKNAALDSLVSIGGITEMAGDQAKWEWLSSQGKKLQMSTKIQQNDLPETLHSFKEIRTDDSWNTIKDTGTYIGNLFAGTIPSMAVLVGSTMATGGLGFTGAAAFGLSSAPSSLMYAGNFYAGQEQKNAGLAMSLGLVSGVLDRIGLHGMLVKEGLFSIAGKQKVLDLMMQSEKYATLSEAKQVLENATKQELVTLSQAGAEFAKHQLASKEAMARGLATLSMKAGGEAGTESAQQLAEMVAKKGDWNMDAQYDKGFYDQLLDAAVGGGAMAGTFHGVGAVKNNAQWHSIANGIEDFHGQLSEAQQYQAENQARRNDVRVDEDGNRIAQGGYKDIADAAQRIKLEVSDDKAPKLSDIPTKEGAWNAIKGIVTDPARLLRQLAHTAIPSIMNEDGTFKENLAVLKSIMGGYGILPGDHAAGYKQRLMGKWGGHTAEQLSNDMNVSAKEANSMVKDAWQNVWSKGNKLPPESPLQKWYDNVERMRQSILTDGAGQIDLSTVDDIRDFFESATVNPDTLKRNRERVIQSMVASGLSNRRQATEAIHNILSGDYHKASSAKRFMSAANVFSDPSLNDIFETNVFASIESLKERSANHIMNSRFIGKDGAIIAKLLTKAKAAGELTDEEFDKTAKEVKDWVDIIDGNYHPLDKYPRLEKLLGWGTTLTMLASLGKAAISSQVEVAMSTLGTPADLINKQLGTYAKTYAREYANDVNKFTSWTMSTIGLSAVRKVPDRSIKKRVAELEDKLGNNLPTEELAAIEREVLDLYEKQFGRSLFQTLGYAEAGYNAASKFEYNDSNMRNAMKHFASAISLRAQTDSTRMALLSVAGDIVLGKLFSLMQVAKSDRMSAFATGKGLSNEQAQSLQELQQYGMNVYDMTEAIDSLGTDYAKSNFMNQHVLSNPDQGVLSETEEQNDPKVFEFSRNIKDNLLTTLGNLVDSRIVNPQAHNLPKYYHDPRLRVITVMGRFMAAAHSVILPRLYKQYLLDGNVGMKYQAFSTIAMALVFAHFVGLLKDALSYEEDNPYVKGTRKKIQRVVNSSGLLGQYERVLSGVAPVYPSTGPKFSNDPTGWAIDKVTDVSPVASWAAKPIRGVNNIVNGDSNADTVQGVKQLVRAAPLVGSFPRAASDIAKLFKD